MRPSRFDAGPGSPACDEYDASMFLTRLKSTSTGRSTWLGVRVRVRVRGRGRGRSRGRGRGRGRGRVRVAGRSPAAAQSLRYRLCVPG